jgi:hypothetical protein
MTKSLFLSVSIYTTQTFIVYVLLRQQNLNSKEKQALLNQLFIKERVIKERVIKERVIKERVIKE